MPIESAAPTISGRKLGKTYPGDIRAIEDVDVDIAPGSITALVGANGAGKSTLLGMLAGVLSPSSGEVSLLGLRQPSAHARSLRKLQTKLAYVDQDPALDPEMTGGETLRLFAALYGVSHGDAALASELQLAHLLPRPIATYSGGQKRRLHIALALLHSPQVIFLDEPTAGLDAEGARFLWAELDRRTQAGATVVLVGHDLAEIEREAGAVFLLDRGRVIAAGSPAALVAEYAKSWLRVTLTNPPASAEATALESAVAALPGFSQAHREGRRLWVQVDDPSERRIGELLAALRSPITDVVVHRRDLAGVYRTLTGAAWA